MTEQSPTRAGREESTQSQPCGETGPAARPAGEAEPSGAIRAAQAQKRDAIAAAGREARRRGYDVDPRIAAARGRTSEGGAK